MNRIDTAMNLYKNMNKEEKDSIVYLFIIDCLNEAIKGSNKKIDIEDLVEAVHDYWLDTEIQISRICDILVENYDKIENDDFSIYDYVDVY